MALLIASLIIGIILYVVGSAGERHEMARRNRELNERWEEARRRREQP
jgi:hypothetical protein